VGTGPDDLVQLDGSGYLPALNASLLTNFPTLNQSTSGTAANLSGTPALPNGTTATTQSQADASTKLATTAYVDTGLSALPWQATNATFASPPSSPVTGSVYIFTDASAVGTCAGTGTSLATCRWSGSAWQAVSGGSGGGTVVSVATTSPILGGTITGSGTIALDTTKVPQKFFGTSAPGSVSGNLPGDLFTDTTAHNEYVCNAPAGTATPACTSVTAAGWLLLNGSDASKCNISGCTFTGAVTFGVTSNQQVFGTGSNLTTVNYPASSGAVTVTMPNVTSTVCTTIVCAPIASPTFTAGITSPIANLTATTNQIITGVSTNLTTVNFPASSGAVTVTMPNVTSTVCTTISCAPASGIALSALAAQAADTVVMNATSGSAAPTAVAMPVGCAGANLYNTSTHAWSCVSTGGSPADLGSVTWNNAGTCTYEAASNATAGATLATVHGQSCTLSPTGLVKYGSYQLIINNDAAGGGATLTLGTAGACSAWKITGGGSGAVILSPAVNSQDQLQFTFDGTNCRATMYPNQN
jgi:hypothetical protein